VEKTQGVKFVRIHGRIVPIKGKGSAPKGVSKRYGAKRQVTKSSSLGAGVGLAIGSAAGTVFGRRSSLAGMAFNAAIGGLSGAFLGKIKVGKKGKGESDKQAADRMYKGKF